MIVGADKYTWFEDRYPSLSEAFCLTLARGLRPEELLGSLDARLIGDLQGVEALEEPAYSQWSEALANSGDGGGGNADSRMFIGVTEVGGWTLAFEPNGFIGVTDQTMLPISTDTRIVSHFRNVNAVGRCTWYEDGQVRTSFDPLFPSDRYGGEPDALIDAMVRAGFDPNYPGDNHDGEFDDSGPSPIAATFALVEELTGIQLTGSLLDEAVFQCGLVASP